MEIDKQVLTVEQMKHLRELGLEVKDTAFSWGEVYESVFGEKLLKPCRKILFNPVIVPPLNGWRAIPTLTLQEIIILLPPSIKLEGQYRNIYLSDSIADGQIWYETINCIKIFESDGKTLLESAYQMLCWVIENGYLKDN